MKVRLPFNSSIRWQHLQSRVIYALLAALFLFAYGGTMAPMAFGKTFKVNSAFDVNDLHPGDGVCVAYLVILPPFVLPFCTLRAAVEESNSLPGEDKIEMPSGIFSFGLTGDSEDLSATGDLDISEALTVTGSGADKTIIDAGFLDRVVDITPSADVVKLQNLSLINGAVTSGKVGEYHGGGAIRNRARLILNNVALVQHRVSGMGIDDKGGILYNTGQCRILNSTFKKGESFIGGGIFNSKDGIITVISSTISNNRATIGAGVSNAGFMDITNSTLSTNGSGRTAQGGALDNHGTVFLQYATLAYNTAESGGGVNNTAVIYLKNSIIGKNFGRDCRLLNSLRSQGHNLDSDGTCMLDKMNDIRAVEPGLRKLQNYGGFTETHALFPSSPARDGGEEIMQVGKDQRGVLRPQGKEVDIGAVEYDGFPVLPMIYPLISN